MYTILNFNLSFIFFFNDTATTEIYTLSLHDALPILVKINVCGAIFKELTIVPSGQHIHPRIYAGTVRETFKAYLLISRSEEHTSELQSQSNLVCRLLLEKKKPYCIKILLYH